MIEERKGEFEPLGPPPEAQHRGNTYIGGGKGLFGDGVGVNVYSTYQESSEGDGYYVGTWAPINMDYCIPVTESFYLFRGRFHHGDVYTGHLT